MEDKYAQVLKEIYDLNLFVPNKTNLNAITYSCELFNHPESSFKSIHVAGTNGKGSVCKKISSSLISSGYKVGVFTSPHISSFRERILINNQKISKEYLISEYPQIHSITQKAKCNLTYFEFITLLAFIYFRDMKIDFGVIEVGMGGDLDATNVINPLISVITSIGYDHMDYLGHTLEKISEHKAGIIKRNRPVVLGSDIPTKNIFYTRASELNAKVYKVNRIGTNYDIENQKTALLAMETLKSLYPFTFSNLSQKAMSDGIKERPECRMQNVFECLPSSRQLYKGRVEELYLDAGHNPPAFKNMLSLLKNKYPHNKLRAICCFSRNKDIEKMFDYLDIFADKVNFLNIKHSRLASYQQMIEMAKGRSKEKYEDLNQATMTNGDIKKIMSSVGSNNELVIICGSFFIMKEIRQFFGFEDEKDPNELNESFIPGFKH